MNKKKDRWFGHVVRANSDTILKSEVDWKRFRERPGGKSKGMDITKRNIFVASTLLHLKSQTCNNYIGLEPF